MHLTPYLLRLMTKRQNSLASRVGSTTGSQVEAIKPGSANYNKKEAITMQTTAIPAHIDRLLDTLECTPGQRTLARSLSLAGALASLLDTTPRALLTDLLPALDAMHAADAAILHDAMEGRR
jgi:hypothetical protein